MILATPKYPGIHPFGFHSQGEGGSLIPWSHIQILGGRQLVAFDDANNVIGTIDLALVDDLKIVRRADATIGDAPANQYQYDENGYRDPSYWDDVD